MKTSKAKFSFVTASRIGILTYYVWLASYSAVQILPKIYEITDEEFIFKVKFSWAFITIWNVAFQILYIVVALAQEYSTLYPKLLRKYWYFKILIKNNGYIFTALVFPFSLLTATMFWLFYCFNSEFLAPLHILSIVPFRVQVGAHLMILIPLITETLCSQYRLRSYKMAFIGFNVGMTVYFLTITIVYVYFGKWMYSIFEYLDWMGRITFATVAYISGLFFFHMGAICQKFTNRVNV